MAAMRKIHRPGLVARRGDRHDEGMGADWRESARRRCADLE
jgi:hypothetical protein